MGQRVMRPPIDSLRELISQGMTIVDLAAHFGVLKSTIQSWMREYALRAADPRKIPVPPTFAQDVQAGLSDRDIAYTAGVSRTVVRQWRIEAGLPALSREDAHKAAAALRSRRSRNNRVCTPDMLAAHAESGNSPSIIGSFYGVSGDTIRRWMVEAGISLKPHHVRVKEEMLSLRSDLAGTVSGCYEALPCTSPVPAKLLVLCRRCGRRKRIHMAAWYQSPAFCMGKGCR